MKWPTKPLHEVARRIGGGTPARQNESFWGGNIPWFTVADLLDVDEIQRVSVSREAITVAGLQHSAAKTVPKGAVLFTSRVVVGKVGIAESDVTTNQDFSSFVPSSNLDPEFLAYYLLKTKADLRGHQRGATIKGVTTQVLDNLDVPVPSLTDQRRIIGRIKECMERVNEIETLRTSSLVEQQCLSASLIESELTPAPGEAAWPICAVGELVTAVRNGRSIAQDTEGRANGAVLTLTAVRGVDLGIEHQKPIALPESVAKQFGIDEGDVFVSRANTIELVGLAAVTMDKPDQNLIYPDLLIKLKANRAKIFPRFLAYALRSAGARAQIKDRALGSSRTMVKISGERLREVCVPVPPLETQERIVSRLDAAHGMIHRLASDTAVTEIEVLRGSILRKAFAGEL